MFKWGLRVILVSNKDTTWLKKSALDMTSLCLEGKLLFFLHQRIIIMQVSPGADVRACQNML